MNLREQLALEEAMSQLHELGSVVTESIRPLAEKSEREEAREQQLAQLSKVFHGKPHYQKVTQDKETLEALLKLSTLLQAPSHQPVAPKATTKPLQPTQATPSKPKDAFERLGAPVIVDAQPKPNPKFGRSRILRPMEK